MRARNIKPSFFRNEVLADVEPAIRMFFIGLWCMADREGLLEYRPKRIWAELFPYDQTFAPKVVPWLSRLEGLGFLDFHADERGEIKIIEVVNFKKHQTPHVREKESELKPLLSSLVLVRGQASPRSPDVLIPDILNPDVLNPEQSVRRSSDDDSEPVESEEPILTIPLNKKDTFFSVFQEDIDQWKETFPSVDVDIEIKRCRQWSIDNPKRRKTAAGIRNHISSWLGRVQDKAGNGDGKQTYRSKQDEYDETRERFAKELVEAGACSPGCQTVGSQVQGPAPGRGGTDLHYPSLLRGPN